MMADAARTVRQDPKTGAVAVKLPKGSVLGEWAVMTLKAGGHFARTDEVSEWPILLADPSGVPEA
jgi:hypothetical protein